MNIEQRSTYAHAINIVTLACNLSCKLCILCAPYYEKPWHPDLEYINQVTNRAFSIGDYEIFEFNGGEPLLRNDLPEVFEYALRYINNAGVFKTVTNGSKLPSSELVEVWQKYGEKFYCIVDDYGAQLSPCAGEILEILKKAGIPCELRDMNSDNKHHGGWADFRADVPKRGQEAAEVLYSKCAQAQKLKHCCNIIRGIVMPCHLQFQLNDKGICSPEPHEFIDLFDDEESLEVKREKMAGFQKVKKLSSCAYCPGLDENTQRFKPAEQIGKSEISETDKIFVDWQSTGVK